MPPKIRGMARNLTPSKSFTLMLSSEDALVSEDDHPVGNAPPKGLPHERFLLGNQVPVAPILLLGQSNLAVNPDAIIAALQPVHLHATRDHLILMQQKQVQLSMADSSRLLKVALPLIEEDFQNSLLFAGQHDWFIEAGPFSSLASHSIDQAHGRNIDWWMPRDTHEAGVARSWRKLQNEIQMLWHIDPVNIERTEQGLPAINSVWISGIGKLADVKPPEALQGAQRIFGSHPLLCGLARYLDIPYQTQLSIPTDLAGGFAWLDQPKSIWPKLKQALEDNELEEMILIDFPKGQMRKRILTAKTVRKKSWAFWRQAQQLSWEEITQV